MDAQDDFQDAWEFEPEEPGSGFTSAVLLVIALAILVVSFVWFVIRLDPLTDDFIGNDSATPAVAPTAGEP
jgi:hypothetical protein